MTLTRTAAASTALALCLAAGAGIGVGQVASAAPASEHGKTAKVILADAQKAVANVTSVHVTGTVMDGKDKMTVTATLIAGVGASVKFSDGPVAGDIIALGKYDYLKGNAAFYGKGAPKLLLGQWVRLSAGGKEGKDFASLVTLKGYAKSLTADKLSAKVATSSFHGAAVDVLTDNSDKSLLLVSDASALPLKATGPKGKGSLLFTYNVKATIKAPATYLIIKGL